ncbi:NAD(P)-dependent oxidoreductase [Methylohalobius crimeensis]|uniref:NAD(P)-dependent oxidoreductase n=1 Tax=Methylohalobius crimeensis TaxID=244365 RepID=UPI0003B7831B|nr:NAD(P)-dependent oxidoreductase [Methylohalobius crimeensis]
MAETKSSIAWLGTGLMGRPMAERLLAEGYHPVKVWNRTPSKAEALREKGAQACATPGDAAADSEIVFTMLSDFAATEAALQEIDPAGKVLVQMATVGPEESRQLADRVNRAGGAYLEAPVLGSIPEAKAGKLIIMAGGSENVFVKVRPLLTCLGSEPRLIGETGKAAACKLALNQLIASLTAAFATSLAYVEAHGAPVDTFMDILKQSALYAPTFDKKLPRMAAHDYRNPNFPTEHLIKDIDLFVQGAGAIDTQVLEKLRRLYQSALEGHEREDYSCVFEAVLEKR